VKVDLEHVVRHPVARVFAFMADVRNRPRWQENTHDVEPITGGEPGVGSRWRETVRGIGTYEAEVVAFERDRLWIEAADLEAGSGRIEVRFAPEGDGAATRVAVAVDIRLRGTKRLMEPALGPMIRRQMPADLARLEELLADQDGGAAGTFTPS
jgi:uncharacterized protein YndB with AHSA1/START domain